MTDAPERANASEQRVTAPELFFDLVFVFAITQVTGFLADHLTWIGLLQGLFILGAMWWPLDIIVALALCAGLAFDFAAHVAERLRIGGGWGTAGRRRRWCSSC